MRTVPVPSAYPGFFCKLTLWEVSWVPSGVFVQVGEILEQKFLLVRLLKVETNSMFAIFTAFDQWSKWWLFLFTCDMFLSFCWSLGRCQRTLMNRLFVSTALKRARICVLICIVEMGLFSVGCFNYIVPQFFFWYGWLYSSNNTAWWICGEYFSGAITMSSFVADATNQEVRLQHPLWQHEH